MSANDVVSIVDDDDSARAAVAGLVRSFGFVAAEFDSAAEFLKSEDLPRTICLIADVRMPEMTGPELYAHLKASGTPIPTVLITAYADAAAHSRALQAGVRGCLTKPLEPEGLLACIRSAIGAGKERIE